MVKGYQVIDNLRHNHSNTTTQTQPLKHNHSNTTTQTQPLKHKHSNTNTQTQPLKHNHSNTTTQNCTLAVTSCRDDVNINNLLVLDHL